MKKRKWLVLAGLCFSLVIVLNAVSEHKIENKVIDSLEAMSGESVTITEAQMTVEWEDEPIQNIIWLNEIEYSPEETLVMFEMVFDLDGKGGKDAEIGFRSDGVVVWRYVK